MIAHRIGDLCQPVTPSWRGAQTARQTRADT